MPQTWYTLCEIKRDYEIASLNDVIDCAKAAGVPARRGAAKVSRSQLMKMHPHLSTKRRKANLHKSAAEKGSRLVYDSSDGYVTDRPQLSGEDLFWLLNPKLEDDEDEDEEGNGKTG
jgi:hypothetical protein